MTIPSNEKEKKILIASGSPELICDLPYLYKKGGYSRVVVIGPSHWSLRNSSYIDELIVSGPRWILEKVVQKMVEEPFDHVILGDDNLIWTLLQSSYDSSIKEKLYPIGNMAYEWVLDGKSAVLKFCQNEKILTPPFAIVTTLKEAIEQAEIIGWPVMAKEQKSFGGIGVWRCDGIEDLEKVGFSLGPLLIEKYIEGKTICVEPLFVGSELVAYNYSEITQNEGSFTPSIERICTPCPEIEPLLRKLGKKLQLSCFLNMTLIKEESSSLLYVVEIDFRPTKWIRQAEIVGVNWNSAIRNPTPITPEAPKVRKRLRHFPAFPKYALASRKYRLFFSWLFDIRSLIASLPLHDTKLVYATFKQAIKKSFGVR